MNDQLPDFDQSAPPPETQVPSPKKPRRKPAKKRMRRDMPMPPGVKRRVTKKGRGRPKGAKNKPKPFKQGVTVVFPESDKLTGPEMECVLGMLQTLGAFDKDAKQRILMRVRLLA